MNAKQKRVLKALYKPDCYILLSGARRDPKETYGDFLVKANVSFFVVNGDYAAEWEPEHGPIQVWHRCNEDAPNGREHYFFDFTDSGPMNWSQLAVETNELPQAFHRGDFDYIFMILKDWASDR